MNYEEEQEKMRILEARVALFSIPILIVALLLAGAGMMKSCETDPCENSLCPEGMVMIRSGDVCGCVSGLKARRKGEGS